MSAPNSTVIAQQRPARAPIQAFPALRAALALSALALLQSLFDLPGNRPMVFIVAGAAAILAGSFGRSRELLYAALLSLGILAWYLSRSGQAYLSWEDWFGVGAAALGIASFAVLCVTSFARQDAELRALHALKSATVLPAFALAASMAMQFSLNFPPKTFDVYLYKFDARLGFEASFWCGSLFQRVPSLKQFESLVYDALGALPAIVFAVGLRLKRRLPFNPLAGFVWAGLAAFCLYQICPGTAPFAVFRDAYPSSPPPAGALALDQITVAGSWRNAMPSMHVTWALMAFSCSIVLPRWIRWFTAVFVGLTCLATLGLGQHYLIDLIVACPFTVAISAACVDLPFSVPARRQALTIGGFATLGWLLTLRLGWLLHAPQAVAWLLVLVTLTGAGILQTRLLLAHKHAARSR